MNQSTCNHPHGEHCEENVDSLNDAIRREDAHVAQHFAKVEDVEGTKESKV